MIQKISFLLFVFTSSLVFSQTEVFNLKQDDGTDMSRKKEGYNFSNHTNGDLAVVFIDRKTVFANLIDIDFNKKTSISGDALRGKYDDLLGYAINGDRYFLLASNSKKNKFVVQVLDFGLKTVSEKELDVDIRKEKFLETIQYNNDLYLLTATKDNQFIIRKLNGAEGFSKIKSFDIEFDERDQRLIRRGFFEVGLFGKSASSVTKVDNRVPNAIEQTAKNNKLYKNDSSILLTIENEDDLVTTLHKIDFITLTLTTKLYEYPEGKIDDFKAFNSFVLKDKLIQLGSSRKEMKMVIKNFDNTVVKEFYIEKDKPIAIKNSPIIQEGATVLPFQNRREMEETSKFLRKITSGHIGVTAYKNGDNYAFTIGGYKIINNGGGGMMMMPGAPMPVGVGGGGTVFVPTYNPTFQSFNSYTSTKSTYFNTTLDNDFNYVEKEDEPNIFEQINEFKKDIKFETAEDVFFHRDVLYFSYYDTKEKMYHLYKM